MTTKTKKQKREPDYQVLQEELELRYGPGIAQGIIDEIRKAENPDHVPGYMPVKAASEVLELFRNETRDALKSLKGKKYNPDNKEEGVVDFREMVLRQDFEKKLRLYLIAQHGFYHLYNKAMCVHVKEVPVPKRFQIRTAPESDETIINKAA